MKKNRFRERARAAWTVGFVAGLLFVAPAWAERPRLLTNIQEFERPEILATTGGYVRVRVKGCDTFSSPGKPALPFRTVRVRLPPNAVVRSASVRFLDEPVTLGMEGDVEFGRTPRPLRAAGRADRPFRQDVADPRVYRSSLPYPSARHEQVSQQRMAGHRVAIFRVYPVEYIPSERRLVFVSRLSLDIRLSYETGKTVTGAVKADARRAVDEERVAEWADNPSALRTYDVETLGLLPASPAVYDYLLVTRASLLSAFQPLIDRKTTDGLSVVAETMESITNLYAGVDSAEKLRNYIRHAYTNWGIQYVLLGGDVTKVPHRGVYGRCSAEIDNAIPCDLYFACLDGTWDHDGDRIWGELGDGESGGEVDLIAEVYVGRAPVDTPAETTNFVSKTVAYETSGSLAPFQSLFAAEYLGEESAQGGDALDRLLPHMSNGSFRVEWLDDRPNHYNSWTWIDSLAALNRSPHLTFHHGHADEDTVMQLFESDVNSLTNETPFFIYSAGCDAGAFDAPDCIAEALVKQNAHGAFAAIMNSRDGWFDADEEWRYSGEFQERFAEQLLSQGRTTLGIAHQAAKEAMVGSIETEGDDMPYRWCYFDLTLFGDPHLPIYIPIVLSVNAPTGPAGVECVVTWNSLSNRQYSVYRATNSLPSGFVLLTNQLAATPPLNTFTDAVESAESAFYRVTGQP